MVRMLLAGAELRAGVQMKVVWQRLNVPVLSLALVTFLYVSVPHCCFR